MDTFALLPVRDPMSVCSRSNGWLAEVVRMMADESECGYLRF